MSAICLRDIATLCANVQRRLSGHALFVAYIAAIGAVIDTNKGVLPEKILLWFVLPCFVADLLVAARYSSPSTNPIRTFARSRLLWAAVFYVAFMILSTIASGGLTPTEGRRFRTYILWGSELLLFLTVTAHLSATYVDFFKRFFLAMSVLLAINAAINLFWFGRSLPQFSFDAILADRLTPVFGTPDFRNATHMAPLFAVYAMGLLGLLATVRLRRFTAWIAAASLPLLFTGIVLTQSRAALLAVLLGAIAIACAASRRWRWAIVAASVAIAVGLWLIFPLRETILDRGTSFRPELWFAYLKLASQHPWLGYGLDRLLNIQIDGVAFEQPHNALIWAQVRGGVFGAAFATIMLGGAILTTFRWWRTTSDVSLFAAVLALSIMAMTEIGFLVYPFNWLWVVFWLPIGLGAGAEVAQQTRAIGFVVRQPRWLFPERLGQALSSAILKASSGRDDAFRR